MREYLFNLRRLALTVGLLTAAGSFAGPAEEGEWGPVIPWPEIAISAVNLPDGRVLTWSSTEVDAFPTNREFAHASVFDPVTETFITVDNDFHDTFCAGISTLENGIIVAAGGNPDDDRTSSFNPRTLGWAPLQNMFDRRWYGTLIAMPNNQLFTTFAKTSGNRSEIYDSVSNNWRRTPNASMQALVDDQNRINARPNTSNTSGLEWFSHLAVTPQGKVFQGGATSVWHMFDPVGGAANEALGQPIGDVSRMYGNAVTYDAGKVALIGGYNRGVVPPVSVDNAILVDLNGAAPVVTRAAPMNFARAFNNTVTLANGELLVIGGNTSARVFDDEGSILPAEIYNPTSNSWRVVDSIDVPRNYHSTALLLKDGRVLSAGGGGCGNTCEVNHLNGQIFSPPYLFNADDTPATRPTLAGLPPQISAGSSITVTASADTTRFTMVRLSGTTHHMNTDQRFLPIESTNNGDGSFTLDLQANPNVLLPGNYWVFALNANGTPSIGTTLQVVRSAANAELSFNLLGSANRINANEIQLTPAANGQLGAANSTFTVDFSENVGISFEVFLGNQDGNGADGMTLTLHADPRGEEAISAVAGPGLGAWGIANGLAFELDTWQNGDNTQDIAADHFAIWDTDTGTPSAAGNPANAMTAVTAPVALGNLENGQWHTVQLDWDAQQQRLQVSVDGNEVATLNGDIAADYFAGAKDLRIAFTASTGGLNNDQRIRGFDLQIDALDSDSDGDGVFDRNDAFPNDPAETADSDGDGVGDNADPFPNDPTNGKNPLGAVDVYLMDGDSALQIDNVVQPAFTAEIVGASRTQGNAGGSLRFEGDDYVNLNRANRPGPWTAALWVRRTAANASSVLLASNESTIKLEQWPNTGRVGFTRIGVADYSFNYSTPLDEWTHLTLVNDGNQTQLYANCELADSNAATVALPLARLGSNVAGGEGIDADVDELRLFDRALTAAEIETLCGEPVDTDGDGVPDREDAFPNDPADTVDSDGDGEGDNSDPFPNDATNGVNPLGALHIWAMDGTDPNTMVDSVSPAANKTIVGATRIDGRRGGGLRFDGNDDYVAMNGADMPGPWTAALWVRRNSAKINSNLLASSRAALKLEQWPNTGRVGFTRFGIADYNFNYSTPLGEWAHLTFVNDGNETRLYANCELADTNAALIDLPFTRLGAAANADLDELQIFGRALSTAEITTLCPEPVDTDGDGVFDGQDAFPNDPAETADSDGDGVGNNTDAFPNDASETLDSDGDGVGDNADVFPNEPTETADSDGDGVGNNADAFPNDASETLDSDGDGVGDNSDAFPNDPARFTKTVALPELPRQSTTLLVEGFTGADRIWNVNPDNNSVSVVSAGGELLAEIAVGDRPWALARSTAAERIYVTNKQSASISIIDTDSLTVLGSINLPANSQPHGIVFDGLGDYFYVVLEATATLQQYQAAGGGLVKELALTGTPRHLSISYDDSQLLVSNFVTPAVADESTNRPDVASAAAQVFSVDPATMTLTDTLELPHDDRLPTESVGPGLPNYLAAAAISFDSATAWVPGKKDNIDSGLLREKLGMIFDQTVRAQTTGIQLGNSAVTASFDHDNSSVATGAALSGDNRYLFVTLETSRELLVYDTVLGFELMRLPTGRAPQSVALSSDGGTAYVHNFMDRSISRFDLGEMFDTELPVTNELPLVNVVSTETLTAEVLRGKQLFYDAADDRLARDNYMSCAACHKEAKHDGRVWDFTQFGEGLRNTTSLLGKAGLGHGLLHWTGNFDEIQDFEEQIRNFAGGTGLMGDANFNAGTRSAALGDAKAGVSADLDAMAAYLTSLSKVEASPFEATDLAGQGKQRFEELNCASCHSGATATDSASGARHDIGTINDASGTRLGAELDGFDTPTLLGLWASAPYLHDGSAATIEAAILAHNNVVVSEEDASAMAAFLRQLQAPAVDGDKIYRYYRLTSTSEINNNIWASAAEINLLNDEGQALDRSGWVVSASSQELAGENGAAANAIDGNAATIWHTEWSAADSPSHPHHFVMDLGEPSAIAGLSYLPRPSGANGSIKTFAFYGSDDGVNWGEPIYSGEFGGGNALKEVMFPIPEAPPTTPADPVDDNSARYYRFTSVSEVRNNIWASAAEIYLLDSNGQQMDRSGWTVSTSSEELAGENGAAANAIDGNAATIWHTQWSAAGSPQHPHHFVIDLGEELEIGGINYLPRAGAGNGTVKAFEVYMSDDGVNWGEPIHRGEFSTGAGVKEAVFSAQ